MPDHGSAYWPLDELSGTVANDSLVGHNGVLSDTAHIDYGIAAPTVTGLGMGLRGYLNGNPYYSGPISSAQMAVATTSFGWGDMQGRQEFTISAILRWHGPVAVQYPHYSAGSPGMLINRSYFGGYYVGITRADIWGDPYYITFGRGNSSHSWSVITAEVDIPASVDYNVWDDYSGTYREPIKVDDDQAWFHLVVRYDGDRKSIWLNGENVAEDTVDDTINVSNGGNSSLIFNYRNDMDWAEVGLWHIPLTDEEIGG